MTFEELKQKLDVYERLMRLDKPIGILLLLWPTLWALWAVSWGQPPLMVVWIFVFGTVLMRSAGCVINDYADREFDGHVERTKNRPMATGAVSKKEALLLAAALSVVAVHSCAGRADAILISCGTYRTFEILPYLEMDTGAPVVSSNQATLWRALRAVGLPDVIPNLGKLWTVA